MSASAALASCSFGVGARTVTLTIPNAEEGRAFMVAIEWAPDEPSRLTDAERKEYRVGRQHAFTEIAELLGINVAVLDFEP